MKLSPIIAQLRALAPVFSGRVAGAAEYEAAKSSTALPVPCAFVVPLDDAAEANASQSGLRQDLSESVAVIVALSNEADARGQSSADAVHDVRAQVFAALLNWCPSITHDVFEYQGGQLISVDRARLWWQFEFSAATAITHADGFTAALPHFEGATVRVDDIDPKADPNASYPGPDGRIETEMRIDNLPT